MTTTDATHRVRVRAQARDLSHPRSWQIALGFLWSVWSPQCPWLPILRAETLNVDGKISSVLTRDQDGDGLQEIWVSYQKEGQRFLGIFHGGPVYSKSPETVVPVDPQAICYGVGDFDPAPGLELVLFSRTSGVLYPLSSGAPAKDIRKIASTDLFFSMPSRTEIPEWLSSSKLDLDGDGLDDLVIPEKHRLRILLREKASATWSEATIPIGYYLLTDTREEKIQAVLEDFAEEDKTPPPLLEATGAPAGGG